MENPEEFNYFRKVLHYKLREYYKEEDYNTFVSEQNVIQLPGHVYDSK